MVRERFTPYTVSSAQSKPDTSPLTQNSANTANLASLLNLLASDETPDAEMKPQSADPEEETKDVQDRDPSSSLWVEATDTTPEHYRF